MNVKCVPWTHVLSFRQVHVDETASDRVPNTSPTAASVSTDLYGGAVLAACQELSKRLAESSFNLEKDFVAELKVQRGG